MSTPKPGWEDRALRMSDVNGSCLQCGRPVPKPVRGPRGRFCSDLDAQPGTTPCRIAYYHEQARQRRIAERGDGRPCALDGCETLIPPDADGNRRYCSDRCQGKATYQATKADPERLERHRERSRTAVARRRQRAEEIYGGKCAVCGQTELLDFDHVNSDGHEHRQVESAASMVLRIAQSGRRLDDVELQLLCHRHHGLKTSVEQGWFEYRVTNLAELHRAMEATLAFNGGILLGSA